MIELAIADNSLVVRAAQDDFRPRHESQLAFWGFEYEARTGLFTSSESEMSALAVKLTSYLDRQGLAFHADPGIDALVRRHEEACAAVRAAIECCRRLKNGDIDKQIAADFEAFVHASLSRPLKEHQFKAALHLLSAQNGANFSVPGSGKTTVVLTAFHRLRQSGDVDALFVVGPPACFAPWQAEYDAVLGSPPSYEILAGGDIDNRRSRYLVTKETASDLFLTTFQTLQRDCDYVRVLFQSGLRFFLVIDEAHYIKQIGGAWAGAVLSISRYATRRCVLTGTPFPRSYVDAFNLFEVLWPDNSPITSEQRHRIELHTQRREYPQAAEVLDASIGPLFYRVRKHDLLLAPQHFHDPVRIRMNKYERLIYDSILDRIRYESHSDFYRDFELLARLRRGRMIRLRQCTSYAALLGTAVSEYSEDLLADNPALSDVIRHYDELETPAKLDRLLTLVSDICGRGQKVVIWSSFVRTLALIDTTLSPLGYGVRLIYGATPFEDMEVHEELTREHIIREFTDPNSSINILIANPAACAESVSLHKACSYAVYYDLSYNCAQYLQSLDRIHRVGGSEHKPAHYYVLQYEDTVDQDILLNIRGKASNMSAVIDLEYPVYSLDMFNDDEDLEAYDRLFGEKEQ